MVVGKLNVWKKLLPEKYPSFCQFDSSPATMISIKLSHSLKVKDELASSFKMWIYK